MKSLFSILLTAVFATAALSSIIKPQKPIQLIQGQTYVYEYTGRLLTGIPQLADQYSGFEIKADLYLQPIDSQNVALKLANVKVGKHNGQVPNNYQEDITMNHQPDAQYQRELTKPIRFVYQNGKVKSFQADQSEPQWSLNIKKSILSLFNLNLSPKKIMKSNSQQDNMIPRFQDADLTVYPIYEDGIGGVCETVYEINQIPDLKQNDREPNFVLNVTKTRNYDNCLTEPNFSNDNFDIRGCPWVCRKQKSFQAVKGYYPTPDAVTDPYMSGCPCGHEPHESPVDSYNFVKYNISLQQPTPIIEEVISEGKVSYHNFGDEMLVIVHQNISLQHMKQQQVQGIHDIPQPQQHQELSFRLPKPQLPAGQKAPLDIPYMHLFGQPNPEELQRLVPQLLDSLASDIVSGDIAAHKDSMPKAVQIVNALTALPRAALEQLFIEVAQPGKQERATPKQQVVRKLFLDALPLAGTNQAAMFIKVLIEANHVSTMEAKEMVEAVPQNMYLPDIETIDAYFELFQNPKVQSRRHLAASAGIAFGKLVKEACVKRQSTPGDLPDDQEYPHSKRGQQAQQVIENAEPQELQQQKQQQSQQQNKQQQSRRAGDIQQTRDGFAQQRNKRSAPWEDQFRQTVCSEQDIEKYVQQVARLLDTSKIFHKKVTLIETLANMGVPQALQYLEPYVSGRISQNKCPGYPTERQSQQSEECDFIRQVVIYALSHISERYPKQVAPLVQPVYSDPSQPYEVRIAAFTTLIHAAPEKQTLERIASQLHQENNRQVKSYVASALQNIGNFSLPCFHKLAKDAQEAYEHAPNDADQGMQYSKMLGQDYYDEKRDFGLYTIAEYTSSNTSQIPRAGYFTVGQSNGPFQDDLIQVGFNAKGVDQLVERILEPNGLVADMFEGMNAKKERRLHKRNTDSAKQAMQSLKEKLDFEYRTEDEPKATIFFKLFDRTSYYALDKQYIHQMIDEAEDFLKDSAQSLLRGASAHYVKLMMPSQFYKVLPSEIGLPIVISHRHPTILSIKVDNAKVDFESAPRTIYPTGINVTALIQPTLLYSSYSFMFAVNPADRQTYGTHVEKTTQVSLPAEISLGYVRPKNLFTWSVIPKLPHKVVYHKTEAKTYISKASFASAPDRDWLQDAQSINTMPVPFQWEERFGHDLLGLGVHIQLNSEDAWHDKPFYLSETAKKEGLVAALVEVARNSGLEPRELHVQLEPDQETPTYGYDFTLKYKWVADNEEGADNDDSDESSASGESDSDESDESSASKSSESKSSSSKSSSSSESSASSRSSEESKESDQSLSTSLKRKIKSRLSKTVQSLETRKKNAKPESNESSDESSNESGSKSFSQSGSKASSQSSSSESSSSESNNSSKSKSKKSHNHPAHNHSNNKSSADKSGSKSSSSSSSASSSQSAQSSESSSSSSSASDESSSFEDSVFDYDDVMQLILGQDFKKHSIRKIAKQLIVKTKTAWQWAWDEDEDSSSSDSSQQDDDIVPATIAHDIAITAVARGPRPSYYAANIMYVHTYDHRTIWVKADGYVKTPVGVYINTPTLFCSDLVVAYPPLPGEFYYDPTTMQTQKAKIQAQIGWGPQCQHEGGIIVTGVMEKTEDQVITSRDLAVQDGNAPEDVKNWFYQQCQVDRSEGKPLSYACERAIIADSYFNQLILDIQFKNIPRELMNATSKFDLALKYALYEYMDNNNVDVHNPHEQIRIVAQYSSRIPDIPLANLKIQKPNENTYFKKIHVPHLRPVSSLLPTGEVYANLLTGYDYTDSCALMEDFVRTFDNVTYQLPENRCQYLVAKDCSPREQFAVYAQQMDHQANTKTITVYVSGAEIKFTPPTQQNLLQVTVDGRTHELTFQRPLTIAGTKNDVRIYLRKTVSDAVNPIAVIEADREDFQILYDGKNAKVMIGSQYQGKTCGLCGDNNDESEDEFKGPAQCIYQDSQDFANSYSLSGQHCEQRPEPQGQRRCPEKSDSHEENQATIVRKIKAQSIRGPAGRTTVIRTQTIRKQQNQQIPAGYQQARKQQERNQQQRKQQQGQQTFEEQQRQQQQQKPQQMQQGQEGSEEQQRRQSPLINNRQQQRQQNQQQQQSQNSQEQQGVRERMQTRYIDRDNMVCFTTQPVLTCVQGVPRATKQVQLDFHCLPKQSPFTQQLIQQADKSVVKQLANKRVDVRQTVAVPTACVQN